MVEPRRSALALVVLASACAGAPVAPRDDGPTAADYAPLGHGSTWSYDMTYPGQSGTMTVQLTGVKDGYWIDDKNGAFRHTKDGLRDRDRYLIRHPLLPGTRWKSIVSGSAVEQSEIVSVGQPCSAAAGRFSDCLVIHSWLPRDDKLTMHIRWTWARGIGLAKLETEVEIAGKGIMPQAKQSLRHYRLGPPEAGPPEGGAKPPAEPEGPGPDTWSKE